MTNQDIESVHRMVEKVKRKRAAGINDMKSWEREALAKEEGRKEGRERVNELIVRLSEAGRTEDLIKSAKDKEYQRELLEEFGL